MKIEARSVDSSLRSDLSFIANSLCAALYRVDTAIRDGICMQCKYVHTTCFKVAKSEVKQIKLHLIIVCLSSDH